MNYQIQSLVFPTDEKHRGCRKLFYRGDYGILDDNNKTLIMGFAQRCDFVTYLNACSWQKWQRYAPVKKLTLHLVIQGKASLAFLGYHKEALTVTQVEFEKKEFEAETKTEITYQFPDNDEQMVGFEITALSPELTIFDGYYTVEVGEKDLNDIILCLATTTCKKEEFIKKNVELIKHDIIDADDEMAKNFYLHVIDNGRTLTKDDINGKHVSLHANPNVGGSGGFARGMIESLNQTPKATHVLLMDDDVLVLPESIKRTYNLLRLAKPEYHNNLISGAMLYYESPNMQHEDIGTISDAGRFSPLKEEFDHSKLKDNLQNEQDYILHHNSYAAWWYCCIPVSLIEKHGLPLPIFIRVDDSEYGLRCNTGIITMNGICVWHMGFATKYNSTFDKYQSLRNQLIAQATSNVLPQADIMSAVYDDYRIEMMRFNYNAAELVIRAIEDFLKGADFIKIPNGEKLLSENMKLNNTFLPLSKVEGGNLYRSSELQYEPPLRLENRIFLKLTWNGQRFWSKRHDNDRIIPIRFDWQLQPERIAKQTRLLAVNPYNETGTIYTKDRQRFKELSKRYKKAMKYYRKHKDEILKSYSDAREELTSEAFWRKYLGMDEA